MRRSGSEKNGQAGCLRRVNRFDTGCGFEFKSRANNEVEEGRVVESVDGGVAFHEGTKNKIQLW